MPAWCRAMSPQVRSGNHMFIITNIMSITCCGVNLFHSLTSTEACYSMCLHSSEVVLNACMCKLI